MKKCKNLLTENLGFFKKKGIPFDQKVWIRFICFMVHRLNFFFKDLLTLQKIKLETVLIGEPKTIIILSRISLAENLGFFEKRKTFRNYIFKDLLAENR